MTESSARRVVSRLAHPASPVWAAGGALVTGAATYMLLVVAARGLGPTEYGVFGQFWSFIIVASFGVFLPVEQVLTRRAAQGASASALLRHSVPTMLAVAVTIALVVVTVTQVVDLTSPPSTGLLAAIVIALVGFAIQFPARGVLAGSHRIREYALVVGGDAVVRALVAVALALIAVKTSTAYAIAIGITAFGCGCIAVLLAHRDPASANGTGQARGLRREVSGLMVAALCMQTLINSPVIISGTVGDGATAAGHLLAVSSLARIPVFIVQAGQATYIGRIAAARHRGDGARAAELVRIVVMAVLALAVTTVVGAAVAGPPVVRLVFGAEFAVGSAECILVASGVGAFLLASVATDLSVALDSHRAAGPTWLIGLALAAPSVWLLTDPLLRSTIPLLIGGAAALVLTLPRLRTGRRVAR